MGGVDSAARRVRPEALRVPKRRVEGWQPSASALLDWLRPRVTRDMLSSIAELDHGWRASENLAALLDIRTTGLLPRELGRFAGGPGEVLSLAREHADNLERAWCCTQLCLCPDATGMEHGIANVAPGLVDSCIALGSDAPFLAEQLLAWYCETDPLNPADAPGDDGDPDDAAEPSALLALLLLRAADDPADPRVAAVTELLLGHPWCPLTVLAECLAREVRGGLWKTLVERILVPTRRAHSAIDRLLDALRPLLSIESA
jgi:hypothetical protein